MGDTPERTPDGKWADTPPPTPPDEAPPKTPAGTGWLTPPGSPDQRVPAASRKGVRFAAPDQTQQPSDSPTPKYAPVDSPREEDSALIDSPREEDSAQIVGARELCAICLSKYKRPSMLRPCLHMFCFDCVMRWREMGKAKCPMCKTAFHSVITDIVSDSDFKVHSFDRNKRQRASPPEQQAPGCEWRRRVYTMGQWARVLAAPRRGYTDPDAEKARVEPWVVRELQSVLRVEDVSLISVLVLATLHEPQGDFMAAQLKDFMAEEQVKHFVHELRCFVNSGMDTELYDNATSYERGPPTAEHTLLARNTAVCAAASRHALLENNTPVCTWDGVLINAPVAQQMMANMGWQQGEGLGRLTDGISEAIQPVQRKKRAGLGLPFATEPPRVNVNFLQNTLRQQGAAELENYRPKYKPSKASKSDKRNRK